MLHCCVAYETIPTNTYSQPVKWGVPDQIIKRFIRLYALTRNISVTYFYSQRIVLRFAAMLLIVPAFRIKLLIAFILIGFADKCSGNADNMDETSKFSL